MIRLLPGDCREVLATLPANSVHCVVTSPPYYGLRDYGTAQWAGGDAACDHVAKQPKRGNPTYTNGQTSKGYESTLQAWGDRDVSTVYRDTCGKCGATRVDRQIGLEASPDLYLAEMVAVFREVRRVLRPDGTCWVNMGDLFINKQLQMMPARTALALQADGWILRSDIIWAKPNPMPESVNSRPTSAHEHVFLLAKAARYWYDADAVREEAEYGASVARDGAPWGPFQSKAAGGGFINGSRAPGGGGTRNLRNVWTIATAPYSAAHFATYPPALAERCIKAGTSERGCCAACGAPWGRQTERSVAFTSGSGKAGNVPNGKHAGTVQALSGEYDIRMGPSVASTTTGWTASCACGADTVPCTVLDPFAGAGTTLLVADRLQRNAIGIELNPAYTEMAMQRCRDDAPLFASPPPASDDAYDRDMLDLFAEAAE